MQGYTNTGDPSSSVIDPSSSSNPQRDGNRHRRRCNNTKSRRRANGLGRSITDKRCRQRLIERDLSRQFDPIWLVRWCFDWRWGIWGGDVLVMVWGLMGVVETNLSLGHYRAYPALEGIIWVHLLEGGSAAQILQYNLMPFALFFCFCCCLQARVESHLRRIHLFWERG